MSPVVTVAPAKKVCPYCDKQGLPILPLRYAVARADMGNAPKLAAPFGEGVTSIALPDKRAHYTLRLLRAGYLYVYDERYGKRGWSAYQVSEGGYLYPFNPLVEAPAGGWQQMHFSCSREGDEAVARCITVDDAAHAKRIWLGFSDVIWTQDVLKDHASESYREAHMRCIDVAKVRSGSSQIHANKLENLGQKVAEYATTPSQLATETLSYVKKYLPTPLTDPHQLLATTEAGQLAYKLCSKLVTGLLPGCWPVVEQKSGPLAAAAWAFAGSPLFADAELAVPIQAWAEEQAKPLQAHAGMVALDDPAGVAMELNGLIQQLTAEFTEEPQRKWKHDTAATIKMFEHAVKNGVVEDDNRHGNSSIYAPTAEAAAKLMAGAQDAAWEKYAKLLKGSEKDSAQGSDAADQALKAFQADRKSYEQSQDFPALEQGYLAWLGAKAFQHYFTHNYDRKSLASGSVFTEVLGAVIDGLSGRKVILAYLKTALAADPSAPGHLVARAFALNHDGLIQHWLAGAEQIQAKDGTEQLTGALASVYAGWQGVMAGEDPKAYRGIAKFAYRMSAPILDRVNAGLGRLWLQALPEKRMVAMMGALAKLDNPKLTLVDFHGTRTDIERAATLNQAMGKVLGKGLGMKSAATRFVKSHIVGVDGLVLIDEDKLKTGRTGGLTAATLDEAMVRTAPRLGANVSEAGLGVVGFILTAINCKFAWHAFQSSNGAEFDRQAANLFGQVTGLTGSSFDAASAVLKVYNANRLGAQFSLRASAAIDRSVWLSGAGRILGGAGSVIGGIVGVWQGVVDHQDSHKALGWAEGLVGAAGIFAGILMFTPLADIGLLVGIAAFLLMLLIGHFEQNPLQNWIEQSKLGDGKLPLYKGQVTQTLALQVL